METASGNSSKNSQHYTPMDTDVERLKGFMTMLNKPLLYLRNSHFLIHRSKKAGRIKIPETISNNTQLAAINRIGEKQQSLLTKVTHVEETLKGFKEQLNGINTNLDTTEEKLATVTAEN